MSAKNNDQPKDQAADIATLMTQLVTLQNEMKAMQEEKARVQAGGIKVQRDFQEVTRAWAEEWMAEPCVDTEFIVLGCDRMSFQLEPDRTEWNRKTHREDPVPECWVAATQYHGPMPERIKKRFKTFCVVDLASEPHIEITEEDIARNQPRLPAGIKARRAEHKLLPMWERMMEKFRAQKEEIMPLERFKLMAAADLKADWEAEAKRKVELTMVEKFDAKHLVTGQIPEAIKKELASAGV